MSLATVGAKGFEEQVATLLGHERAVVRRNAAFLAGKIGNPSLRPGVVEAYGKESDQEAKYAMEDALPLLR